MTEDELAQLSPRRRAEALAAAGLVPEPRDQPPPAKTPPLCHGCREPLDPIWPAQGVTLHPLCEPPKPDRRRRGKTPKG